MLLKTNLILKIFSFVIGIYCAALVLEVVLKIPNKELSAKDLFFSRLEEKNQSPDKRTESEWLNDNKEFVPVFGHTHTRSPLSETGQNDLFPLAGISNSPTLLCNETGRWASYESDAHGFPNPNGAWDEQPQVVIVGDSFASGSCYNRADAYDRDLRHRRNIIVIALPGANIDWYLASFKEYVSKVEPPLTILMFYENDIPDFGYKPEPLLARYYDLSYTQDLISRQSEIDELWQRVLAIRVEKHRSREAIVPVDESTNPRDKNYDVRSTILLRRLRNLFEIRFSPRYDFPSLIHWVETLAKLTRSIRTELAVVYIPSQKSLRINDTEPQNIVAKAFKSVGIHVYSIADCLDMIPENKRYIYPGSHFTPAGYGCLQLKVTEIIDEYPKH